MFDEFDFNHDGRLDAAESAFMHDTLFGNSDNDSLDFDYDDYDDDDDDDYYYRTYGTGYSSGTSSYRAASGSTTNTYRGRKYGLTVGQSIWYGLIAYVLIFGLLRIDFDSSAEYLPLFLWGGISALIYFISNSSKE